MTWSDHIEHGSKPAGLDPYLNDKEKVEHSTFYRDVLLLAMQRSDKMYSTKISPMLLN